MKHRDKTTPKTRDTDKRNGLAGGSNLLEYSNNTVTPPKNEHGSRYEITKCHCRCSFCPDCCKRMGYKRRAKLIPILKTFKGVFMVTLTIDPTLFTDPKAAYLYTMKKRCISVTIQDLHRWGHLATRQYFYVVEWQMENTEQVHYHVLCNSTYVPWDAIVKSWSKHRPKDAGPVTENRPVFGYVSFTAPQFADAAHAARYATKYLTKFPRKGFPKWVLDMGKDRRVRRFGASRGFWGTSSPRSNGPKKSREKSERTYRERVAACGDSIHVFQMDEYLDKETGELVTERTWLGQAEVNASVLDRLWDPGEPKRRRRSLLAQSPLDVRRIIEAATGQPLEWRHYRRIDLRHPSRPIFPLPVIRSRKYPEDYILPGVLSDEL